ncbi:MAG: tetratricopeptide repeat protein, partial [Bauldia sp.]
MTSRFAGRQRGRLGWRRLALATGVGASALAFLFQTPTILAGSAPPLPALRLAEATPLPRLKPRTPAPDAIGALIAQDEAGEAAAREDSDLPEAGDSPATAPAPVPRDRRPLDSAGLNLALKLLANGDPAAAMVAAYALPNRVDIKIVEWLVATGGDKQVSSRQIADLTRKLSDWPGQSLLRLRHEQAVVRERPPAGEVIRALGLSEPTSEDARLLLARAYLAAGRKDDAARLIRDLWRDTKLSADAEKIVRAELSKLLTSADHKARMDRLLYAERSAEALRAAKTLDKNQQALAKAVVSVIKRESKALKALDGLPSAMKRDPVAIYARIQLLRRADKIKQAAELLAEAPRDPKAIVDPDAWWIERRLISRALIEDGNAKLAYRIAAGHSAESSTLRAEAEFHAGWYALEYLRDPATAAKHFAAIAAASTRPLSASRAQYWLGRAAAAAADGGAANDYFQRAAAYPTTFYGQLASARLGRRELVLSGPPAADNATR